jgi:iron complex transport system ATP-binding protein
MREFLLEVEGLSCHAGKKKLLEEITFSVSPGDFLSIIGPNGAGKTTLIKCINRINPLSGGQIRLHGDSLQRMSQREIARSISYIPQSDASYTGFTVFEFVMMGRYPYFRPFTAPATEDTQAVEQAMELLDITDLRERSVTTLSGGERQKVLIAAAMAQSSEMLLLDEPTTFLDPAREAEIARILKRLNQEKGTTVVSVTHDINLALRLSNSILLLNNGRIAFSGSPAELMQGSYLEEVFQTSFFRMEHPESGEYILVPEHHQ